MAACLLSFLPSPRGDMIQPIGGWPVSVVNSSQAATQCVAMVWTKIFQAAPVLIIPIEK